MRVEELEDLVEALLLFILGGSLEACFADSL